MTVTVEWNDEQVDLLKRMWGEGASASEVARAIGSGATRSAVIGKVNRLNLPKRSRSAIAQAAADGRRLVRAGPTMPSVRAIPTARNRQHPIAGDIVERVRGNEPFRAGSIPEEREEGVDVTHLIGIMDLNEHTCRWPIGDPCDPAFGYCGAHVAEPGPDERKPPYCEHHMRRAYLVRQ